MNKTKFDVIPDYSGIAEPAPANLYPSQKQENRRKKHHSSKYLKKIMKQMKKIERRQDMIYAQNYIRHISTKPAVKLPKPKKAKKGVLYPTEVITYTEEMPFLPQSSVYPNYMGTAQIQRPSFLSKIGDAFCKALPAMLTAVAGIVTKNLFRYADNLRLTDKRSTPEGGRQR